MACPTSPLTTCDRLINGAPDEPVILFVGRLEPRKGIDTFLEAGPTYCAASRGYESWPPAKRTIPGRGPPKRRHTWPTRPTPTSTIGSVPGVVDEEHLVRLYSTCDILVAPSRYESFGLIAVEAMRAGKPVIASDVGGLSEIVVPGGGPPRPAR